MDSISRLALYAALFAIPTIAQATPIVSVYKDELTLSAYTELGILGGGTFTRSATYQGPLLPIDRQVGVSGYVLEEPCNEMGMECGDVSWHGADAKAWMGSRSLNLYTYSLFYSSWVSPDPSTQPVWDRHMPIQESVADLSWVFSVDQDLIGAFGFFKRLGDGYTSGRLVDKTAGTTLFDYPMARGYRNFYDIALIAGHKYELQATAADVEHDDDSEAEVYIYFSEDVTFASVPEPVTLLLFATGLLSIGLSGIKAVNTA